MEETAGTIAKESLNLGANPYLAVGLLFVVLAGLLVGFGYYIKRLNERIDTKDGVIATQTDKFTDAVSELKTEFVNSRVSHEASTNRLIDKIDNLKDLLIAK